METLLELIFESMEQSRKLYGAPSQAFSSSAGALNLHSKSHRIVGRSKINEEIEFTGFDP